MYVCYISYSRDTIEGFDLHELLIGIPIAGQQFMDASLVDPVLQLGHLETESYEPVLRPFLERNSIDAGPCGMVDKVVNELLEGTATATLA